MCSAGAADTPGRSTRTWTCSVPRRTCRPGLGQPPGSAIYFTVDYDAPAADTSGAVLAAQFSTYKPFEDASVDGKLTLSESLADLAGLAAAYDAWRERN